MTPERGWGDSTRAVHAGLPPARQGEPLLPGPALAAPFHLRGEVEDSPYGYGRDGNPTFSHLEAAIAELEGGEAVVFASGMAAVAAVVLGRLRPGDVLVAPHDGYPGIRKLATERLEPIGVEVRFVATDTEEVLAAVPGAKLVWVETPCNPGLGVCDVRAVAAAAREAGALLAVDNTVATPLGQSPLALGADFSMMAATKSFAGHSDLLLGSVAVSDPAHADDLRAWRTQAGAVPGPFEAWLAHRSVATLDLRLARQSDNALAIAAALREHPAVSDVRHPADHPAAAGQMRRFGALVGFALPSAAAADAFLGRTRLVFEATSFGGVHTTAERRARWGTDAISDGFIRLSAGIEDAQDLLDDIAQALEGAKPS